MTSQKTVLKIVMSLSIAAVLAACGGSSSSSGGAQDPALPPPTVPNTTEPVVGPNLNGDTWAGYIKDRRDLREPMTAVIRQVGSEITIETSFSNEGGAGKFVGKISASGKINVIDQYNAEDWTTLYGPASKNSINLADFVFVDGQRVNTNIIILKRTSEPVTP